MSKPIKPVLPKRLAQTPKPPAEEAPPDKLTLRFFVCASQALGFRFSYEKLSRPQKAAVARAAKMYQAEVLANHGVTAPSVGPVPVDTGAGGEETPPTDKRPAPFS